MLLLQHYAHQTPQRDARQARLQSDSAIVAARMISCARIDVKVGCVANHWDVTHGNIRGLERVWCISVKGGRKEIRK